MELSHTYQPPPQSSDSGAHDCYVWSSYINPEKSDNSIERSSVDPVTNDIQDYVHTS